MDFAARQAWLWWLPTANGRGPTPHSRAAAATATRRYAGPGGGPGGIQADITIITVWPILILSPFFTRWAAWIRRPLSHVPLVEPRSLTYQSP